MCWINQLLLTTLVFVGVGCTYIVDYHLVSRDGGDGGDGGVDGGLEADVDIEQDGDAEECATSLRLVHRSLAPSPAPSTILTLDLADLDDDDRPEAILATEGGAPSPNRDAVVIYRNRVTPDGRALTAPVVIGIPEALTLGAARAANLNGDTDSEIVAFLTDPNDARGELWIFDAPLGSLTHRAHPLFAGVQRGVVLDLDGDIFIDMVGASWDEASDTGRLLVWNRHGPELPEATVVELGDRHPGELLAVNVTDAGFQELIVAFPDREELTLFQMSRDALVEVASTDVSCPPLSLASADVRFGAQPEIVVGCGRDGAVLIATAPSPGFGARVDIDRERAALSVVADDLNGDDDAEVIIADDTQLRTYCNNGAGLELVDEIASGGGELGALLGVAPIDDDALLDVVWSGPDVSTYLSVP